MILLHKITFTCLAFTACLACKPRYPQNDTWTVTECKHAGEWFSTGDQIKLYDTCIHFINSQPKKRYPMVRGEKQLVINADGHKSLFKIIQNDSNIILIELYRTPQALIKLKKYTP